MGYDSVARYDRRREGVNDNEGKWLKTAQIQRFAHKLDDSDDSDDSFDHDETDNEGDENRREVEEIEER